MAATALLKFTQNLTVGGPGRALKGVVGVAVDLANSSNTDVVSWQIDLIYADPNSGVTVATPYAFNNSSNTPAASFTPDVPGSYRWQLKVWTVANRAGTPSDVDIRVFSVPETNGLVVPPTQIWPLPLPDPQSGLTGAKPNEMNFNDQPDGWAGNGDGDGGLNDLIRRVDPVPARFTVLESQIVKYTGVAGPRTTNLSGPLSIGSITIDPSKFPNRTFKFEAVVSTEDALAVATIRLYNLTDGELVTGASLTSSSLTLEHVISASLTVGTSAGNLKNSLKTYEVQLFRAGGTSEHFVDAHLAQISISV